MRRCGARVAHAFLEPASRCSIAALLATLLALIANTRACGSVQPLRSCHAAELPVVQPMGERHNTSRLSVSAHRQILLSLCSAHDRRHIFNVLWCVPAYASLRLAQACACCITAVDFARRYDLHALAARQRRQLTPRLLVTGWTLLLLAQLAMLSACMHGRPRRRRYHRRRRRRRRHHRRRRAPWCC